MSKSAVSIKMFRKRKSRDVVALDPNPEAALFGPIMEVPRRE